MRTFEAFLVASRAGIQATSFPTASLGLFLAARGWTELIRPSVFVYVLIFFVILTYSCQVNCLHDLEVDRKYKRQMSDAVESLGMRNLKKIMSIEIGMALALVLLLVVLERNGLYLLALLGVLIGYVYSAPPLRLKKRGILSPLPVMIGLYYLPVVAGWFIIRHSLSALIIFFGLGYALIMQGITFINTCEDSEEDRLSGIRTWAHILGPNRALRLGALFVLGGGVLDIYLLISHMLRFHISKILVLAAMSFSLLLFAISILDISRRLWSISRSSDPVLLCKRNAGKMPAWFALTRYPLLLSAMLLIF